tara:strand:+ start:123 stop:413 length:291 start_codon:yes stop_codon:yes gene_type:complete
MSATPRTPSSAVSFAKPKAKKKSSGGHWKKKKDALDEEAQKDLQRYRDRAEERRLGKNIDYEASEKEILSRYKSLSHPLNPIPDSPTRVPLFQSGL